MVKLYTKKPVSAEAAFLCVVTSLIALYILSKFIKLFHSSFDSSFDFPMAQYPVSQCSHG